MKTPKVAGLPSTELVDVPIAVVSHLRRLGIPVFDARGKIMNPGERTARDTQMVHILIDDHAELLDALRGNLGQLMVAESIPDSHRAWTLQFVLRNEIALLRANATSGELPLGLPTVLEVLSQFVLKSARAPGVLLQIMDEDEVGVVAHSLHTAFLTLLLSHATGTRRAEQLTALAFGAVFADVGLAEREFTFLLSDGTKGQVGALYSHPRRSLEIMRRMGLSPQAAQEAVLWHHERWDGHGYPDGVSGEDLPFSARCIALAEHYAIASARRRVSRKSTALGQISELGQAEELFEPGLQDAFVRLLRQHTPGLQMRRRS
jgi:HD-GYP domain-containing protein (c-di-GMP phosphodiesterase class II)